MTIIAYRDGVLAADSAFAQESLMWGQAKKIWQRADGTMIGGHGTAGYCEAFRAWVLSGEEGDAPESKDDEQNYSDGLIIRPDGSIEIHTPHGVIPFRGPFYAMGSGAALAIGAMAAGANAIEAVKIAIEHDIHCGGPVTVHANGKDYHVKDPS